MQIQISLLLDRSRTETLTDQLVSQLRDAIRLGRIAPGARLPSSRRLCEQLGIGRNTVVRAYELLEMESYVETRPASGIFAGAAPRPAAQGPRPAGAGVAAKAMPAPRLVPAPSAATPLRNRLSFDFAPARANAALFPLKTWRRLLQATLCQSGALGLSQPADPFGLASLRAAIANHLAAARGIAADPGQIVITSGAAEGLALAARLFVGPGSPVAVEAPCWRTAASIFSAAGGELIGVEVDEDGLVAADLPDRPATLLYLTPAHQYPTGHALSAARREKIVAWARRAGCYIVEDDIGAEFRYEGGSPPALAAAAPDCAIHLGSFSLSLGAGLRLGYMVVPAALVDAARAAKALLNGGGAWLEQEALAEMLRTGSFAAHLMRMRIAYRERRDHLLGALRRNFGEVEVSGASGGLHLFWQLPPGVPDAATVEALGKRARVGVYSLDPARIHHAVLPGAVTGGAGALARRGLMLGYGGLNPRQIEQGIARLSDAVDDALDGNHIGLADLLTHRPAPPRFPAAPGGMSGARRQAKPAPPFRHQPALCAPAPARAASRGRTGRGLTAMPVVTGLYHYPVKGLSAQPLATVRIAANRPFPFDRVFALARPGVAVTAENPKWAKKGLFVMLMLDEGLARVQTHLDPATEVLTVQERGRQVLAADLADDAARRRIEALFHGLAPSLRAPPTLVRARPPAAPDGLMQGGHFMDKPDNVISLINLATVRSLEERWGVPIDPLRFRANIYIDGAPAWEEFEWVGSDIRIGEALFRVDRRNGRCGATNVDPLTGNRDLDIPGSLRRAFGHKDLGVYLVALTDSSLAVGDAVAPPGVAGALLAQPAGPRAAAPVAPAPAGSRAFICRGCYFVYHEAAGLPQAGIAPGTPVAAFPAGWMCPDCGTDKSNLQPHPSAAEIALRA